MVIGQILAYLSIEIVRREQWIGKGPRQMGIDGLVDDAMLFILAAEQWMSIQNAHIVGFLVGRDDKRGVCGARPDDTKGIEYLPEGSADAAMFERAFCIELACAFFLSSRHGARPSPVCLGQVEHKARIGGDADRHFTREVLGDIKGNESIDTDSFLRSD